MRTRAPRRWARGDATDEPRPPVRGRSRSLQLYELSLTAPVVVAAAAAAVLRPADFDDPMLLFWVAAIAVVDLLPVATSGMRFSLSFPLQLTVALLYPPPVAMAVAFLGASDVREVRREIPLRTALFIRAEIAASVAVEALLFHSVASVASPWPLLAAGVAMATVGGYAVNVALVAWYVRLRSGARVPETLRGMHVGYMSEFLMSYALLALIGVVIATSLGREGPWSVIVLVAPLVFAHRMFVRTRRLEEAAEELRRRQAENEHQAVHDSLTGLPNRAGFRRALAEALGVADHRGVGVLVMDLDHFKEVNDALGHVTGDALLRQVGPRLREVLREEDDVARLGGDEFGILVPGDAETARDTASRVRGALERAFVVGDLSLDVAASIGVVCAPEHGVDPDTLLQRADVALYVAKEARTGHETYDPARDPSSPERLRLLGQLRKAIDGQLVVHYQPKARLSDGRVTGVEALVRWEHPELGLVFPDRFVGAAERTTLIGPLTLAVLRQALGQVARWRRAGLDIEVAVNVSVRNLADERFADRVQCLLDEHRVPPDALRLEITESALMTDPDRALRALERLAAAGVGLSVDDFGTGYSSLTYLKRLPVSEIKIDRSFVMNMAGDADDAAIVRSTVELGHNLGLRVVAEGVEDADAWDRLARWGCDVAQGYHLARPLPPEGVDAWLSSRGEPAPPAGGGARGREAARRGRAERRQAAAPSR